jgi:hypothetical protein
MITAVPARDASLASLKTFEDAPCLHPLRVGACPLRTSPDSAMQTIHAEAPRPVRADPSVVELASASRRPPISATRPHITRLGREHVAQLIARLCGLDKLARINRFGHPASNPCVQAYAKQVAAGAAYMAGAARRGPGRGVCGLRRRRRRELAPVGHWLGPARNRHALGRASECRHAADGHLARQLADAPSRPQGQRSARLRSRRNPRGYCRRYGYHAGRQRGQKTISQLML